MKFLHEAKKVHLVQYCKWLEFSGASLVCGYIIEREGIIKVWCGGEIPRVTRCRKILEARGVVTEIGDDDLQEVLWEVHRPHELTSCYGGSRVVVSELGRVRTPSGLIGLEQDGACGSAGIRTDLDTHMLPKARQCEILIQILGNSAISLEALKRPPPRVSPSFPRTHPHRRVSCLLFSY